MYTSARKLTHEGEKKKMKGADKENKCLGQRHADKQIFVLSENVGYDMADKPF